MSEIAPALGPVTRMMRATKRRNCTLLTSWATLAAVIVAAVPHCANAQGGFGGGSGGPGGSGMNSLPAASMFKSKDKERDASGPSLSATDEPVGEIRIIGNRTIPTDKILNQMQTRVGRPFDPALVQRDVRTLNNRGWFLDVQPSYEQNSRGRVVILKVVERPVIRYIQYIGNSAIRDKKLGKEADLQMGGPVDPYMVEDARKKLLELYHTNGFNQAQVTVLEGNKTDDQGIVFIIDEGPRQKIWKVEVEGAEFVSGSRVKKAVLESKPPLMYVFKGYLNQETLDADVEKLTAYYRSFGYFQARVGRVVEMNEKGTWATVRFIVDEGPRYDVQEISFIGNKLFANESLDMLIKLPAGVPFEQAEMNGDLQRLKDLYGSQGYVFADIRADIIYLEEPGKLRVAYHIDEGKRWRIGRIFVHVNGDNPHTRIRTALNRLSIQPGDIVDTRELRASEIRLQRSQLFMTDPGRGIVPKITYRIQDSDTELASGNKSEIRGQSPDGGRLAGGLMPNGVNTAASTIAWPQADGPPLIAPPGSNIAPIETYAVPPPKGFVDTEDQIDVYLDFEPQPAQAPAPQQTQAPASRPAPQQPAPAPGRYEARRPPYEDNGPAAAAPNKGAPVLRQQPASTYQSLGTQGNAYQSVQNQPAAQPQEVVRGQSPLPASSPYGAAYAAPTSGGTSVGATGPAAAPVGNSSYAVRQAAATTSPQPTGSQVVQTQYSVQNGTPYNGATAGPGVFGPPALPPPQAQYGQPLPVGPASPLGAPQPAAGAPAFQGPPPVQYSQPAPGVLPDPTITPIQPGPADPRLFPATPVDSFTPTYQDPLVDLDVVVSEAQTGRLMLGVAVNSDAGLVGQILLDEQNFDITRYPTSWDDVVSGKAWRGAGQRFRLEAAPGTQVQRYLASFQEPYLLDYPVSLGLSGSYYTRNYFEWDEQRIGGRVSLGYQWTEHDVSAALAYRGESVNISGFTDGDIPDLDAVKGDNALHGFKATLANDTRDSVFLATQGHYLEFGVEQVVGSFQYPRFNFDGRQYFLLHERPDHSGRHVLTAATQVGITGDDTPIYERFYAGGFTTLRGWDFRGVSPEFTGLVSNNQKKVGGDFMWVNTVEYLFPITADDMMHGVVFSDFGTVEPSVEVEDMRVSAGFGLRITVPAMGPAPIALDFAWPIMDADGDERQVFSFFMGFTR